MQKENTTKNLSPPLVTKEYLTTSEAAAYLDISIQTIYKLTSKKSFPTYKPGNKKIYIKRDDLEEWISKGGRVSDTDIKINHNKRLLKRIIK